MRFQDLLSQPERSGGVLESSRRSWRPSSHVARRASAWPATHPFPVSPGLLPPNEQRRDSQPRWTFLHEESTLLILSWRLCKEFHLFYLSKIQNSQLRIAANDHMVYIPLIKRGWRRLHGKIIFFVMELFSVNSARVSKMLHKFQNFPWSRNNIRT